MSNQISTIQSFSFNDVQVSFSQDAFLNATEIAKQFGKRINNYLRCERTIEYISALSETLKSVTEQNQLVIVKKGGKAQEQGTWLHPKLAIDFARWLNPKFAVWCDMQIENILKGQIEQVKHSDSHQHKQPFNIKDYLNQKSNQVMDYVHSLEHIVFNATGKYPQRPFNKDEIAKGIIGYCLSNQSIELSFSEHGLDFNFVDRTMLRIHDSNIAEHIKKGNVSKKYLDDIIQASVARLA